MTLRFTSAAVAVAIGIAALASCSSSSGTAATASGTAATSARAAIDRQLAPYLKEPLALPSWPALTRRPPRGEQIYYVNPGNASAQIVSAAIRQASADLGWTYHSLTYDATNPVSGNSAYLTAINSGANAIISSGLVAAEISGGLAAAKARHVEVVLEFDIDPPSTPGFDQVGNQNVSNPLWAKVTALGILSDADAHGVLAHVAIPEISGNPLGKADADPVLAAIRHYCPRCSAVTIPVPAGLYLSGQLSQPVVSYLERSPSINYIDVIGGAFEGNLRSALNSAGFGRVKITGFLPTPGQNAEIKSGADLFWIQVSSAYDGWACVDTVARSLAGGNPAIHNAEVEPVWLVDRGNLNFSTSALPEFPRDFQNDFLRLWRVS